MTERIVRRTPLKRTPFKRKPPRKEGFSRETRQFILRRDGGCILRDNVFGECWGGIHAHHIRPRAHGGPHTNDNGASLCAYHHEYVHGHPIWAKEWGLLR